MGLKDISSGQITKAGIVAGTVALVMSAFYVTGLYKNILDIRKLREEEKLRKQNKESNG